MWCLKCKRHTNTENVDVVTTVNGRYRKTGRCVICGGSKSQFVSRVRGGDIAKFVNKFNKEFHLPGYNFCGPGTKLSKRLDSNDNPVTKPVNAIDKACMRHDIGYRDNKDLESRQLADVELIHGLNALNNLSLTEKFTRSLIKTAMKGKIAFGTGNNKY